jgi:hypothetical protein
VRRNVTVPVGIGSVGDDISDPLDQHVICHPAVSGKPHRRNIRRSADVRWSLGLQGVGVEAAFFTRLEIP